MHHQQRIALQGQLLQSRISRHHRIFEFAGLRKRQPDKRLTNDATGATRWREARLLALNLLQ